MNFENLDNRVIFNAGSVGNSLDSTLASYAINENYFIFLSSGKNSESIFGVFPYIINSVRVKDELNAEDDFISFNEDKYFDLDYSVK